MLPYQQLPAIFYLSRQHLGGQFAQRVLIRLLLHCHYPQVQTSSPPLTGHRGKAVGLQGSIQNLEGKAAVMGHEGLVATCVFTVGIDDIKGVTTIPEPVV